MVCSPFILGLLAHSAFATALLMSIRVVVRLLASQGCEAGKIQNITF
jgi:hypothetical protein